MAHPIFRPVSNFAIWAYWRYLSIPFGPIKRLREQVLVECFPMEFESKDEYHRMRREKKIPPGAVWDAHWFKGECVGPDGRTIYVQLPHGFRAWCVDKIAHGCMMQEPHHCWVRDGSAAEGNLYIGKKGFTCTGGTGSVVVGSYHARLVYNCIIEIPRPIDRMIKFFQRFARKDEFAH